MLGRRMFSLGRLLNTTATIVEPIARTSVDPAEIGHFTAMAEDWLDESGPMKVLHAFNRVRIPWIVDELKRQRTAQYTEKEPLKGFKLLDVGSGCGILTFPLARLGAQVDGLEPSINCVQATDSIKNRLLTDACRERVNFMASSVEDHCTKHPEAYDAIVVSEVVEHVADVHLFIQSCYELAKPGALLFFSTINRTLLSKVLAVELAELLGFVPKGTHDWNKFITPDELDGMLRDHRFQVAYKRGLVYDPILNEWDWFVSDWVNYALLARKA